VLDALDLAAPVAVTPLAQVHRGEVDGAPIAVKVRRPGLDAALRADLALLDALRPPLGVAAPRLDAGRLLAQIREQALDELDLEHEAAQQRVVARALRGRAPVEIPAGHSELAVPGASVSAFLDGPTLAATRPADPGAVARALVAAHVEAARAGLVLCDPRANHVVLRPDGSVGLLGTGAAVAVDRSRLRGWIALAGSVRAANPGAFAAEAAELALLARAEDARAVHGLLREVFSDLVTGPARLDGAALAAVADRALPRAGTAVALAARARPEPHDVWLGRGGGQLLAVLAGLGAREDWLALLE
jgi:predicted unusual protein kinase regulating ubiquinone biosynthesis (AarF/ABC1/UbiB family)